MNKKAIILPLLFLFTVSVFAQEFTFRGLPWGATADEIIAREGEPDFISESLFNGSLPPDRHMVSLVYRNKMVLGYLAILSFTLNKNDNTLIEAAYSFSEYDIHDQDRTLLLRRYNIETSQIIFNEIVNSLTGLYGEKLTLTENSRLRIMGHEYVWQVGSIALISVHRNEFTRTDTGSVRIWYNSPMSNLFQYGPGGL